MGQLDVLVMWPFAKLRGVPIIWDAFLSLHSTVVEDRKLIGPKHVLAKLLFVWEYLSCRAADLVILDTRAHADYFKQRFKIPETRIGVVFVGVETDAFPLRPQSVEMRKPNQPLSVLFYGQFIPLQGIETIIRAAQRTEDQPIQWTIIGSGQERSKIRDMINRHPLSRLQWIPWVPYRELAEWIHRSDICLGIFGDSDKASRVIPNKVFQILSTGTPLITRDSPAIRELLRPGIPGVYLIPAMDDSSLVKALTDFSVRHHLLFAQVLHRDVVKHIEPRAIGSKVVEVLNRLRIIGS
jgi:glycosyltransferase involved in cell wall biosynthesis